MAINKVVYGDQTLVDLTEDTVTAETLLAGETAHARSGVPVTGTAKQGHVIQNESGTALTQRANLQFKDGLNAVDGDNKTVVSIDNDTKTATDSFTTATGGLMSKCLVSLEPVQDLHGYDYPWVGGAGKNKLPLVLADIKTVNTDGTWSGNAYTVNGLTFTIQTDADGNVTGIKINGTASGGITFNLADGVSVPLNDSYKFFGCDSFSSGVGAITYSFSGASNVDAFKNAVTSTISGTFTHAHIYLWSGNTFNNVMVYPMFMLASESDETFSPYTNICPISGHTEVDLLRDGKNLWNGKYINTNFVEGNTWSSTSNSYNRAGNTAMPCVSGKTYSCSLDGVAVRIRYVFLDINQNRIGSLQDAYTTSVAPDNAKYLQWRILDICTEEPKGTQLELGSEVTSYEPYNGKSVTVQLGQTVYGGTVDLVSGELVVNRAYDSLDGTEDGWYATASGSKFYYENLSLIKAPQTGAISNKYPFSGMAFDSGSVTVDKSFYLQTNKRLWVRDTTYPDLVSFKTAIASNPLQVCYELATPFTIQLTPQEVETLIGQNNVMCPLEGQSIVENGIEYRPIITVNDVNTMLSDAIDEVKGDIPTALSELSDDSTHRLVTDSEKAEWNATTPTDTTDDEPYVLRQGKGNQVDFSLEGASVAWNQLVKSNRASTTINNVIITKVTGGYNLSGTASAFVERAFDDSADRPNVIANHVYFWGGVKANSNVKFYAFFTGTATTIIKESIVKPTIDVNNCNMGINVAQGTQVNTTIYPTFIDLTQLFGTTIADAIYAMEQANEGDGVSFFRKYFPKAYYAYDTGSIQSVCVSERKVVGKNLLSGLYTGYNDTTNGSIVFNVIRCRSAISLWKSGTYTISATTKASGKTVQLVILKWANGTYGANTTTYDSGWLNLSQTFTIDSDTYMSFVFRYTDNSNVAIDDITAQIELGSSATPYEPYTSTTYPLPTTQLRGLFSLVNGKLKANGDVLRSDGKGSAKYGIDDLSTLSWNTRATGSINKTISADLSSQYKAITAPYNVNCLAEKYTYRGRIFGISDLSNPDNVDVGLYTYSSNQTIVYLVIPVNNSAQGEFVYELATPTSISTTPFQNPQRAYPDGTEEFVDGLTRDVIVPVGNNSTYTTSDVLASADDYTDGMGKMLLPISAVGTDESGRTTASRAYTTGEFFYKDGKMYKVLTNIASGATFTVGTNISETTLFAELTALA